MEFNKEKYIEKVNTLDHEGIKTLVEEFLDFAVSDDCDEEDYELLREVLRGERTVKKWIAETYYEPADEISFLQWIALIQEILL